MNVFCLEIKSFEEATFVGIFSNDAVFCSKSN